MTEISIADVLGLSSEKRLELAELLWESFEENPETIPLSEEKKRIG